MIPLDLLLPAVGAGHLIGLFAHEVGALAAWLDERRTDRLARVVGDAAVWAYERRTARLAR